MTNKIMDSTFYNQIKEILSSARAKVYSAANFAMVEAYWEMGKSIVEKQGGNATAEYGTSLLKELSKQMTADFGKGFTVTNLSYMRQFYLAFPNRHTLCDKLSWSHYNFLCVLKMSGRGNSISKKALNQIGAFDNLKDR